MIVIRPPLLPEHEIATRVKIRGYGVLLMDDDVGRVVDPVEFSVLGGITAKIGYGVSWRVFRARPVSSGSGRALLSVARWLLAGARCYFGAVP